MPLYAKVQAPGAFPQFVDPPPLLFTAGGLLAPSAIPSFMTTSVTVPIPNAQVLTLFSVGTSLLVPAQGVGTLVVIDDIVIENLFLTAAFTAGGAIQANYGSASVAVPASATVAATFLTGPVANQVIKVGGVLGSLLSSAVLNTGIYLTCATANFATGAGSLMCYVRYHVLSGLT
jgi:hypothetical protein